MSEIEVELNEPQSRGNTHVSFITIAGRRYPTKTVARCFTCQSVHRPQIEQAIILGMSMRQIMEEMVEPFDHHSHLGPPTRMSLTTHIKKRHMPTPFSVQRDLIEKRAKEMGKNIEEGEELLTDSLTIFRSIVQRGYMLMNEGVIEPSMGDLLKAAQLQQMVESAQADRGSSGDDVEAWREAMIEYMAIVQRSVSPDQFQRIGLEMSQSPILQAISRRRVAGVIES